MTQLAATTLLEEDRLRAGGRPRAQLHVRRNRGPVLLQPAGRAERWVADSRKERCHRKG